MKSFRPRVQKLKFNIKRQFAKNAGIAFLLALLVAITGQINFNIQAADEGLNMRNWDLATNTWKTSGDWYTCDGHKDNDPAHHSFDSGDMDPAHHSGMVCKNKKEAWTPTGMASLIMEMAQARNSQVSATFSESQVVSVQPTVQPTIQPTLEVTNKSGNPFADEKLYVNNYNDPANYVRNNAGSYNASLMSKIASQPEVTWLGGWNSNISNDVSNSIKASNDQSALPVFVVYNIPYRDCGGYSAGGVNDPAAYRDWIGKIASAIGSHKAAVILEPDAITLMDCLSQNQKNERYQMLKDAVNKFNAQGNISVYIDAGHPNWHSAEEIATRLKNAGVASAKGFALNIANFYTNDQNAAFGKQISQNLGGKHFVVDTGRSGSGPTPDDAWCNPSGRSLGTPPTTSTGNNLIDAYLWVKGPGGSDGNCNGGPSAGTFWADYALGLAQRTNW
jgi:endoglucanase